MKTAAEVREFFNNALVAINPEAATRGENARLWNDLAIELVAQLAAANEIAREALEFQKEQWAFNTDPELLAEHQLRCIVEQKKAADKHNAGVQLATLSVGARGRS